MVTGVVGLAAMLWLYGVAWHEPMTESIVAAKSAVVGVDAFDAGDCCGAASRATSARSECSTSDRRASSGPGRRRTTGTVNDADTTALFADRQARLALLRGEGPRMLNAGNWRRAAELCRAWSDLEFWNAEPWRCLGYSLQAQGYPPGSDRRVSPGAAIRSARQHDGSGDRQKPARHRHRLPEPVPAITRESEEQGPRVAGMRPRTSAPATKPGMTQNRVCSET